MRNYLRFSSLLLFYLLIISFLDVVSAQPVKRVVVNGYVKDSQTGEVLIGATVFVEELAQGAVTNSYGFYSITVPVGSYVVQYGYLGYAIEKVKMKIDGNHNQTVSLRPSSETIGEVVVEASKKSEAIRDPGMGMQQLQGKTIKNVPVLMGETDLIKVIQLMPGVQPASEGSTGFSVRGGNPDQNLILLDEASVYNAGHLMGFFSVFNNDAVKDVKLYKGDIPAMYGGRLSSLLDVRMKDGNRSKLSGTGGIGTISSRLTLEGPVRNERTTFLLSARRTYADLFLKLSSDEEMRGNTLYFYDVNAKLSHTINQNNRLFVSGYLGRDVMAQEKNKMNFGNQTFTLRWNHLFTPTLFSNTTLVYSHYNYYLEANHDESNRVSWESDLYDFGLKSDFTWYVAPNNSFDFGAQVAYNMISPGLVQGKGADALINRLEMPHSHAVQYVAFISHNYSIARWWNVRYGTRLAMFQNIGPSKQYYYDDHHEFEYSKKYDGLRAFQTYFRPEPRISTSFVFSPSTSVKAGYSRTTQFIHQATNSTSGSPLDVWFVSSPNIQPQLSDQFSVGFFKNLYGNKLETSVELFYKNMLHSIDFKDHASILLNEYLDGELRFGTTRAMGAELLVKLNLERLNGWVSYTLSRARRTFSDINEGKTYRSPYDRPHDVNIVLNGKLSQRAAISANWVYYTGNPATFPVARYSVGGNIVPLYGGRNTSRMPDYHRLDLAFILTGQKRENRRWSGEWVFSVYNAYGRKNAWSISFEVDENDPLRVRAQKVYLFSVVPSVTYNFKF